MTEKDRTPDSQLPQDNHEQLDSVELPRPQPPEPEEREQVEAEEEVEEQAEELSPATADANATVTDNVPAMDRKKMVMLGGGLAVALLFFAITMIGGHSSRKPPGMTPSTPHAPAKKIPEGVTPVMDALRKVESNENDGQLTADDIKRMRPIGSAPLQAGDAQRPPASTASVHPPAANLGAVPSFADTQQNWEDPRPYDQPEKRERPASDDRGALHETSLVFVRSSPPAPIGDKTIQQSASDEPILDVTPGSRVMAKLRYAASTIDTAPVVLQVEYTYAIGDQVLVPAGALIYGHIEQADRAGYMSFKFTEIEIDHKRQLIDAVGRSLDMGPIKGKVTGTNAGKNLFVRSVSGIGSTLAMVFGNNTGSAFSEDDLIRERLAENIGTAGDSEIMNLTINSKAIVSVDANTQIYVVFTKHEQAPSTLRKVNPPQM